MLARYFPEVDPLKPPFINAVSIEDQWSLLQDMAALDSKAADG